MDSQTLGAESGLFGHFFQPEVPNFLESWPSEKPEVRLKKGRRFLSAGSLVSLISGADGGLFGHLFLALFAPSQ